MAPGVDRVIHTRQVVHIPDLEAENSNEPIVKFGGARTILGVPMLKENEAIGVIAIYRREVRPFGDEQIKLVQSFAAQAVIAIDNARLLNELRQSLEQQTATAEVLRVISTSPNELDPVFRTMLTNATRLCEADFGQLLLHQGDGQFLAVAMHNAPPAFAELRKREPMVRFSETLARAATDKQIQFMHISDCTEDAFYKRGGTDFVKFVDLCKVRTLLGVKLQKDVELIVIAIENVRLLNELRQSLRLGLQNSLTGLSASRGVFGIYRKEVRPFTEARRPPMCLKLSAVRPSTCSRCWTRWLRPQRSSARPIWPASQLAMAKFTG
jgi:hypothetical protein